MNFDWNIVLSNIRTKVSEKNFSTWFKSISFENFDEPNKTLVLNVPDKFTYNWIMDNYFEIINESVFNYLQEQIKLNINILEKSTNEYNSDKENQNSKQHTNQIQPSNFVGQIVNPKYTFENFIVGNCNEYARAASLAVSEQPGKNYNPLFIYGGTGLGKLIFFVQLVWK